LLVRQAVSNFKPLLSRTELFALASSQDVHSRLVIQDEKSTSGWHLRGGPFCATQHPCAQAIWLTLLLQGVDLHNQDVHTLMNSSGFCRTLVWMIS